MKNIAVSYLLIVAFAFTVCGQEAKLIKIQRKGLSLEVNSVNGKFKINHALNQRVWTSMPYRKVAFKKAEIVGENQLRMFLHDSTSNHEFSSVITLETDSSISFLLDMQEKSGKIDQLIFPPAITTNYEDGTLVFCYRSGGVNLKQTDASFPVKRMMVYDNIGLDMPWIGVYDAIKGDGMMLLAETPYDVEMDFSEEKGLMWPNVGWSPSLRNFAYSRKVSYVFTSSGNYVSLAKVYRNYLKQTEDFKTLQQKATTKPRVNWLKGNAIVWGSSGLEFAKEAKALGIKRLTIMGSKYTGIDIKKMTGLGYLNSSYENLEGTREGPIGHMKDTMAIAAYLTSVGKPIIGWTTKTGVEYYSRSSVRSLLALPLYLPDYLELVPLTGLFLDVTPAFLLEDYHPLHTFNREMDKTYKIMMKEYIGNGLGLVLGGEHGKAWNASILEYSEGTMSGSFFWDEGNKPGYLEPPKDSTYMSQNFKKYGHSFKNRIPLWQLVFNDAVSSTWYWGDSSDWFYAVDPTISDVKDNFNILYGSMPLMWADKKGYGWDRNRSRFVQTLRNVCNFQERVAFSELLSHQFLNKEHTLQHSTFVGGAEAYVNFSDKPITHKIGEKNISLAPRGFYAQAPGYIQTKTSDKIGIVTKIESDSLFSVTTDVLRKVGPIKVNGNITVFKIADKHWRIIAENATNEAEINLKDISKSKKNALCSITELNEKGKATKLIAKRVSNDKVIITPGTGIRLYDVKWQ